MIRRSFRLKLQIRAHSCSAVNNFTRTPTSSYNKELVDRWTEKELFERVRQPIAKATTIPPESYFEPSFYEAEQQQLWRKQWFCVGHATEIPNVGDVKVIDVGSQSFIITRAKNGQLHAFYNVCRHRGARLAEEGDAFNKKRLNCPYHWWSYRLTGELISTPHFDQKEFKKKDYGLLKVNIDTFAGMIFLNQDNNCSPLNEQLGALTETFQEYPLQDFKVIGKNAYNLDIDWKLLAENFMEWYHVPPVHPELAKFSTLEKHKMWGGKGQYVGFITHPVTNCGGPADTDLFNPTPSSNDFDGETAFFYHIWPNVSVTIYPHSVYTLVMLPNGPGKCKEILSLLQHPDSRLATDSDEQYKKKTDALLKFVTTVNDEDIWVCNRVSKGLRSERYSGGRFSPDMEQSCYRFQNMYADTLTGTKPGLYPEQMTDYYKCFPQLTATAEESQSFFEELINIEGLTSEDYQAATAEDKDVLTLKVVEYDPQAENPFHTVAEINTETLQLEVIDTPNEETESVNEETTPQELL